MLGPWNAKRQRWRIRLGGALWWFWWMRGHNGEGRHWLEEALAIEGRGSPEVRAMALAGVGHLALEQGDLDRAKEACERGLELLAHEGREASEAKLILLAGLGWVAWERQEYEQAKQLFEESLALSQQMRYTWWLANSLSNLAVVSDFLGNSEKATELYEESMHLFREQGDKRRLATCLNNLAMEMCTQGDLGRAANRRDLRYGGGHYVRRRCQGHGAIRGKLRRRTRAIWGWTRSLSKACPRKTRCFFPTHPTS